MVLWQWNGKHMRKNLVIFWSENSVVISGWTDRFHQRKHVICSWEQGSRFRYVPEKYSIMSTTLALFPKHPETMLTKAVCFGGLDHRKSLLSFYLPAVPAHIGHSHNQGLPRNMVEDISYMIGTVKDAGRKTRRAWTGRGSTCSRNETFSPRLQKDLASETAWRGHSRIALNGSSTTMDLRESMQQIPVCVYIYIYIIYNIYI